MLSNMLSFSTGMLSSVGSFLCSEPIIYLVSFMLASITIKIIRQIIKN